MPDIKIYTDGGCHGNPGPGGWAFVVADSSTRNILAEKRGGDKDTTNNRMELLAAISALEYVKRSAAKGKSYSKITIFTDSQYVQKGITEWIHRWKKKDWRNSDKEEVKNKDLWLRLDNLASLFPSLSWVWVQGHAGNELNERADKLTQKAVKEIMR